MRPFGFFVLTSLTLSVASFLSILSETGSEPQAQFDALLTQASRFYEKGDFLSAHRVYQQAGFLAETPQQERRLKLHLADTSWRMPAGSDHGVGLHLETALRHLESLLDATESARDEIWAAAHLSLGDFFSKGPAASDWSKATYHYQQALDWWTKADREAVSSVPALVRSATGGR